MRPGSYIRYVAVCSVAFLLSLHGKSQLFEVSFDPVFKNKQDAILHLALLGGLTQPQFSSVHLNSDGVSDLFVFDRDGHKVLTFVSENSNGKWRYRYDPSYEQFFPKGEIFMLLLDFDNDQKADLWTRRADSLVLYKNTTNGLPSFNFPFGLLGKDNVNISSIAPYLKLDNIKDCIPAIVDIDNDGDIDYLSILQPDGNNVILARNDAGINPYPLNNSTFTLVDKCYGGIGEKSLKLKINFLCDQEKDLYKKKHSLARNMLFFDNDDDGDLDLIFSNGEEQDSIFYFLENGKTQLSYYKDTFLTKSTSFFPKNIMERMPVAPGVFYLDIDHDGIKDMVFATSEVYRDFPLRTANNVLYFKNNGTDTKPNLQLTEDDFFAKDLLDFGDNAAPAFADLDSDGDFDLVVATSGDHFFTGDSTDYLVYFENVGSSSNPIFKLVDSDFLNLKPYMYKNLTVSFADLDSDQDWDMYLGKSNGTITFIENTGTKQIASWTKKSDDEFPVSDTTALSPCFYDLNKDGLQDLLLGRYNGAIAYYENTGTYSVPQFSLVDSVLGGIMVSDTVWYKDLVGTTVIDTWRYNPMGLASVQVIKRQHDKESLAVGTFSGKIRIFDMSTNIDSHFLERKNYLRTAYSDLPYSGKWSFRTQLAAADLDNDSISDILFGNSRGGLSYLRGVANGKSNIPSISALKKVNFYPNPSKTNITVELETDGAHTYSVINLQGKEVLRGSSLSKHFEVSLMDIANGIYIFQLSSHNDLFSPQKLVVSK